ncbi:unnamed protein product, partial [Rotaria sp. Silwood1]
TSKKRASIDLGISRRRLGRLMQDLNLKLYKPRLLQALNEDDPDRRTEFCEWVLDSFEEDPTLLDRILWTDEAIFKVNGRVNRHNCVYWSDTNPHLVIEQELNVPQVVVWGGIWSNGVVGPYFFEGNSTVNMMRWSLRKAIDNKCTNVSKFSNNCNVKSRVPVRITARNTSKRESIMTRRDGETILIADTIPTWGVGKHATTQLIDDRGNEQAIYIQKFA